MEDILQFLFQHMLSLSVAAGSILLAAFFAAAETALVFANKQALQELAVDGNVRARTVLRLMEAWRFRPFPRGPRSSPSRPW